MLDTNTASWLIKGQPNVLARLAAEAPERICLSVVTEAELLYGLARRPEAKKLRAAVDELLGAVDVLAWTTATARRYATIRAHLAQRGRPLAPFDVMIAAHAVERDAMLVTYDRAFGAVPGLRVEDWTTA
jgi:tRNA(fMet)-specific endonuclease VapC